MSEIRLLIARHGETDYNLKGLLQGRGIDAPLNKRGHMQAKMLGNYLGNYNADGLIASSLQRTWQTANPYQQQIKLDLIKKDNLDEMDFGEFEGLGFRDISAQLDDIQKAWKRGEVNRTIPGGESPKDVFERANGDVQSLLKQYKKGTLVMVLHGRLIRILLSEWLGYGLQNMHEIEHQNGAVNQLIYKNEKFEPVYLNKTSHLKEC